MIRTMMIQQSFQYSRILDYKSFINQNLIKKTNEVIFSNIL